jgi:hypothetical protein
MGKQTANSGLKIAHIDEPNQKYRFAVPKEQEAVRTHYHQAGSRFLGHDQWEHLVDEPGECPQECESCPKIKW